MIGKLAMTCCLLVAICGGPARAGDSQDPGVIRAVAMEPTDQTSSRIILTNYYRAANKGGVMIEETPTEVAPPAEAPTLMPRGGPLPPDPWGPERMTLPTPVEGFGYLGAPHEALNTSPDAKTMGIRLDTSYTFLREFNSGVFLSEHQDVFASGVTILPYQSPCLIIGTRALGSFISNNAMVADTGSFSLDLYGGTRYKDIYIKMGPFWDSQGNFGKVGFTYGALAMVPVIGNLTADCAFGWGVGTDVFGPTTDPLGFRLRRVQNANNDIQLRIGKFCSANCQVGITGNYYDWSLLPREWGAGAFSNWYWGRFMLGLDVTGGREGLRGFVQAGWSWGSHPNEHPQDCRFIPLDTVAWVTRAVNRDISLRLRQAFNGPLPPLVVP